jgi:hypothetical protein
MRLLNIFSNNSKKQKKESEILLAMPMFNNDETLNLDAIIYNLKDFWELNVGDQAGDNDAASFNVEGEEVAIGYIGAQIPWEDIEETAKYAYNWLTCLNDLEHHNGHAIIAVMTGNKSALERYKILSKVLCAIFTTSNAIGVYQGARSLLIPRKQYLNQIDELKTGGNPVMLWIYFGLRKSKKGNSAYTYGLKDFQKQEMEIIDSSLNLEDLYEFLTNIAAYVLAEDITIKSGETIGFSIDQKIKVTTSKGQFVSGQTLKLGM